MALDMPAKRDIGRRHVGVYHFEGKSLPLAFSACTVSGEMARWIPACYRYRVLSIACYASPVYITRR